MKRKRAYTSSGTKRLGLGVLSMLAKAILKNVCQEHRRDPDITKYDNQHGRLLVSWASVVEDDRDGIERHLADTFPPKVGKIHPNAEHILVNAPWGWPS